MLQDTGFLLLTFVLSNIWKSEMLLNPGWLTSVFETWCLFEKQTRVPVATDAQNSHTTLLHLRTLNLCPIPHCLKFRCTFLIFSVWPIVGNVHSMGFASWCHGLIWISLEWKNRYSICQNVCHMFDKYKKSGPHCPFTQLFDQCRDVVGI